MLSDFILLHSDTICFSVTPNEDTMFITGLPEAAEADTEAELTCTVNSIKPEAKDIYWVINGQRVEGFPTKTKNKDGKTFRFDLKLNYV